MKVRFDPSSAAASSSSSGKSSKSSMIYLLEMATCLSAVSAVFNELT
jgi:hypothetical protein